MRSRGLSARAEQGDDVLMRRLEELEATELHERNVAAGKLQFERRAVVLARNRTAWLFSAMPASRRSSTCSAT